MPSNNSPPPLQPNPKVYLPYAPPLYWNGVVPHPLQRNGSLPALVGATNLSAKVQTALPATPVRVASIVERVLGFR